MAQTSGTPARLSLRRHLSKYDAKEDHPKLRKLSNPYAVHFLSFAAGPGLLFVVEAQTAHVAREALTRGPLSCISNVKRDRKACV